MQVQVNSNQVTAGVGLHDWVGSTVEDALERFDDFLTRVEIHVSDENADKAGAQDKRCQIEARPKGHSPISVTHKAEALDLAVQGAADKMCHALEHLMGRLDEPVLSTGQITAPEVQEDSSAEVDAMLEDEFLAKLEAAGKE
ncbi:HPF/RaiA family ribosome-associated protein [Pseudomonas sp. Marseille-Q5115]|uniref:HPF/RaiA family ribosome-associated protein n=1 Tax=Pseudomonas sp. Marseille-Q5115 TaxID=2866593 RepID=UPI001CE48E0A|nr:HPF/RaiA family ribosome-associated protein [Pseudomonas sp. Marseille-Q5115]